MSPSSVFIDISGIGSCLFWFLIAHLCHSLSLFCNSAHTDPFWRPYLLRYSLEICLQTIPCPGEDQWVGAGWGQHRGSPFYCALSLQASTFTRGSFRRKESFSFWLCLRTSGSALQVWNGVVGNCLHADTFWGINNAVGMREMPLPCALVHCLHLLHLGISSFSSFWRPHAFSLPFSGILVGILVHQPMLQMLHLVLSLKVFISRLPKSSGNSLSGASWWKGHHIVINDKSYQEVSAAKTDETQ